MFTASRNSTGKKPVSIYPLIIFTSGIGLCLFADAVWSITFRTDGYSFYSALFECAALLIFLGYLLIANRHALHARKAQVNAEQALAEQVRLFEVILDNLPGILFIKNAKDNYRYFMLNQEAEKFFGHTREEMVGKFDDDFFTEEETKFFRTMDNATMAGGNVVDIPCEIVTTPTGEAFVHTRKVPIYDIDGNPAYLVGLAQDITRRKKNEMELSEYRENLERMVDERTLKLKHTMARAEEASRLKSEFLATMSHEIRSPMSGVLGMAELLLDTPLTLEQKNLTRTILSSGEVLMNIIEDILDFSKIEANKLELDPVAINLLDLVDDVCMLYSSRARVKGLELVVRYVPGSEQFVYADPVRIRQVLGNLLNNAIKFTQKGYVVITVAEDREARLPDGEVRMLFSIEDTGVGIEPKDYGRIFEKFSQANSSTTREYGGTGLGLSICRKLIELMSGSISFTSTPGAGTTFKFDLAMKRNRHEVQAHPRPPVLAGCRVLIVDDLPAIRLSISEQLQLAGMICDTAENGHLALQKMVEAKAKGRPFDMLIIDYLMPGMNGEMLARAINDEEAFRKTCLIMLTAAGSAVMGKEFAAKGFSSYITKPARSVHLIETLAMIWERYKNGETDTVIKIAQAGPGGETEDETDYAADGARVLLVEDSRLNQAFAEEVLTQLSCEFVTVSNGREALDTLARERFDLVLMDCQMPIMDGFEAAQQIVIMKQNGTVPNDLPVIALTANAMKGDRQRCLEAGMSDYITKPVRKRELKEKIHFWLNRKSYEEEEVQVKEEDDINIRTPAAVTGDLVDIAMLNEARSLLKDKFAFLLGCYIDDVESYIKEMNDALAGKNIDGIIRPAHTIKSTSRRMGALPLSDMAARIERAARDAADAGAMPWSDPAIIGDIRGIATTFEQTKQALNRIPA